MLGVHSPFILQSTWNNTHLSILPWSLRITATPGKESSNFTLSLRKRRPRSWTSKMKSLTKSSNVKLSSLRSR